MSNKVAFAKIKSFLVSWALHFDTPDEVTSAIPYPQIYCRMKDDVLKVFPGENGKNLSEFISRNTETTDGETYLCPANWNELKKNWNKFNNV